MGGPDKPGHDGICNFWRKNRVEDGGETPHIRSMSEIIPMKPVENGPDWKRMARAIRFLTENYLDQPSLDETAEAVGLSPFHFQRLFTRYVGVSPKNFVGHLTLDHARQELAGGQSVLGAALDAGLSGPSRLHDLCLKIEAMTPGDYARGGEGVAIDSAKAAEAYRKSCQISAAFAACDYAKSQLKTMGLSP